MGKRPKHIPTERTRGKVEALAAYGMQQRFIAYELQISQDTLAKYYRDELDNAKARLDAKVIQQLAKFAIGDPGNAQKGIPPTAPVYQCTIFWAKTRCGLSEKMAIEHSGKISVAELMASVDLEDDEEGE